MNMMPQPDLTHLLFLANEAEIGISVITSNPQLLRNKLYAERKRCGLTNLTFVQPPTDSESRLWIIKKEAKANGSFES
jgi:hypothetical protein